jgi:metal transporter CNNM
MVDYFSILIVVVLVLLSGLFSGLTLGLLGLDRSELERKIRLGDRKARKVYQVRKRGNLLLCTLLLGNVAVNSAIAIFLGSVATGVIAGFVATGLIVVFGEILPQAFVSRHAMSVGAKTAPLVKLFIVVLYPVAWPISVVLDKMLGEEMGEVWSRRELKEIVSHHRKSKRSRLDRDEERILHGALSFSDKRASDVMISAAHVFSLDAREVVDRKLLNKMRKFGFSRFPVYRNDENNIVGVFFLRDLAGKKLGRRVSRLYKKKVLKILETRRLDSLLSLFMSKRIHMASVFDTEGKFVGIVTLEDVVEEVFGKEIVDEDDLFVDVEKGKRVRR